MFSPLLMLPLQILTNKYKYKYKYINKKKIINIYMTPDGRINPVSSASPYITPSLVCHTVLPEDYFMHPPPPLPYNVC